MDYYDQLLKQIYLANIWKANLRFSWDLLILCLQTQENICGETEKKKIWERYGNNYALNPSFGYTVYDWGMDGGGGQEDALLRAKWRRKQILKVSVIIMCWHTVYNWNRRPKSKFCANAFLNIYWNLLNTLINSTLLKCMQFTIHAYWY